MTPADFESLRTQDKLEAGQKKVGHEWQNCLK
jgi:hypothetical protein